MEDCGKGSLRVESTMSEEGLKSLAENETKMDAVKRILGSDYLGR